MDIFCIQQFCIINFWMCNLSSGDTKLGLGLNQNICSYLSTLHSIYHWGTMLSVPSLSRTTSQSRSNEIVADPFSLKPLLPVKVRYWAILWGAAVASSSRIPHQSKHCSHVHLLHYNQQHVFILTPILFDIKNEVDFNLFCPFSGLTFSMDQDLQMWQIHQVNWSQVW